MNKTIGLIVLIFVLTSVYVSASESFSQVKTGYFSNNPSSSFGPNEGFFDGSGSSNEGDLFDLVVTIPPAGCRPFVVRSDLLEEQNVPVFCELTAVKINPGVDISKIDRITFSQNEKNQYIQGVGFYPSRSAVRSSSNLINTPVDTSIGYVVVVLKKQKTEKDMPDVVSANLTAVLTYGADNAFRVGNSEIYVPQLDNNEFENRYKEYGFLSGQGYLRVENLDEKGATVSVYSSDKNRVSTVRLDVGKTSGNIYLRNLNGGQSITLTLKSVKVPETKAKLVVDGDTYEVVQGESFGRGCKLISVESYGGGTGKVRVNCENKVFNLEKSFADITLKVNGETKTYKFGEKVGTNGYIVYLGNININGKDEFSTILYNFPQIKEGSVSEISKKISEKLSGRSFDSSQEVDNTLEALDMGKLSVIYLNSLSENSISIVKSESTNGPLGDAEKYYETAKQDYYELESRYGNEPLNSLDKTSKRVYGEEALWKLYDLTSQGLEQNEDKLEVLSKLINEYPGSVDGKGNRAQTLFDSQKIYSFEGSSDYDSEKDISIELISVNEPRAEDASVDFSYNGQSHTQIRKTESIDDGEITLVDFSDNKASFKKTCTLSDKSTNSETISVEEGRVGLFERCSGSISVKKINLNKVAKVEINGRETGRSRETNFSFSIGIEKRAKFLLPSPEQASKKIEELNKTIKKWEDINKNLGNVVKGMKAACLATSVGLSAKQLLGYSGEASARNYIMTQPGGWNDLCEKSDLGFDKCLMENRDEIEQSVDSVSKAMNDYNSLEKKYVADNTKDGVTNYNKVNEEILKQIKQDNTLISIGGKTTSVSTALQNVKTDDLSSTELRTIYTNLQLVKQGSLDKESGLADSKKTELENGITSASVRAQTNAQADKLSDQLNGLRVYQQIDEKTTKVAYQLQSWKDVQSLGKLDVNGDVNIDPTDNVAIVNPKTPAGFAYLIVLQPIGGSADLLGPKSEKIYKIEDKKVSAITLSNTDSPEVINLPNNLVFQAYSSLSYKNQCKNCKEAKFFGREPYKGLPKLLPFDPQRGWYVSVDNLIGGFGGQGSYQSSGRVNIFWICNVGGNGLLENAGYGDDICMRYDSYTGNVVENFPGLDVSESKAVVREAISAIESASKQIADNPSRTTIDLPKARGLKVVNVDSSSGGRCTDSMSVSDCQILFNVCDPVVCPSSRCDLGGTYPVDDVIQSGIIGSVALCLPNIKEGVYIPVCLTGIHAGVDGWTSILKSHRDCLQEQINSNRTVGICDEIYSVYQCDFFWKQVGPFASAFTKGVFTGELFNNKGRGGGEYLFINDAFNSAEDSFQYFTKNYASQSKLGFGGKSVADIGSELCKLQVGTTYPDGFDAVLEPESPVQIHAWFDEMPYEDATVPPRSQYKVYYHIYAGNDVGAQYSVYLKNSVGSIGYSGIPTATIGSGYAPAGQSVDETKDILLVSGFKELCVRVNTKDYCGFKQVSTSFALNYAKDKIVQDQVNNKVTSEKECISGTPSLAGTLTSPNLQTGVENSLSPEIYNQGVVRVCATNNPGQGVAEERWESVGYCGNTNIQCWVDKNSVKEAITGTGIENDTIKQIDKLGNDILASQEGYIGTSEASKRISEYSKTYTDLVAMMRPGIDVSSVQVTVGDSVKNILTIETDFENISKQLVYPGDKAKLLLARAKIYDDIARNMFDKTSAYKSASASLEGSKPIDSEPIKTEPKKGTIEDISLIIGGNVIVSKSISNSYSIQAGSDAKFSVKHSCNNLKVLFNSAGQDIYDDSTKSNEINIKNLVSGVGNKRFTFVCDDQTSTQIEIIVESITAPAQ